MQVTAIFINIRSVHNVGSMFRTADAAGVEKIYLCGITPTPHDRFGIMRPDFEKVALGADVAWESAQSATRVITKLKKEGWTIIAVEQSKDALPYTKIRKAIGESGNVCFVMGNEIKGLSPALLKRMDCIAEIPMRGATVGDATHPKKTGRGKESLNVGVAFGIVLFGFLIETSML